MNSNNQNDILIRQSAKISSWIAPRLNKFETILAFLFLITLLGKMLTDFPFGIFMVIVLETLAILYFFSAFPTPNSGDEGGLKIFMHKIVYIGCSIAIVGIIFRLQCWPGYKTMCFAGAFILLISLLVNLIMKLGNPELKLFNNRFVLRMIIIAMFGLLLTLSPADDLIKYRILKAPNIENVE